MFHVRPLIKSNCPNNKKKNRIKNKKLSPQERLICVLSHLSIYSTNIFWVSIIYKKGFEVRSNHCLFRLSLEGCMWGSNRTRCFVHCKCLFSCEGVAIRRIREAKSSWDRSRKCLQWRRKGPTGREEGGTFLLRYWTRLWSQAAQVLSGDSKGPTAICEVHVRAKTSPVWLWSFCGFAPLSSCSLSWSDLVGRKRQYIQSHLKEKLQAHQQRNREKEVGCDIRLTTYTAVVVEWDFQGDLGMWLMVMVSIRGQGRPGDLDRVGEVSMDEMGLFPALHSHFSKPFNILYYYKVKPLVRYLRPPWSDLSLIFHLHLPLFPFSTSSHTELFTLSQKQPEFRLYLELPPLLSVYPKYCQFF